jgi:hypothetical protein
VADVYKDLIQSVGEEMEMPRDAPVVDFMDWLANELATLNEHMNVGREYASMISLRAFAQALTECGCDHVDKVEIKDPLSYWIAPNQAHDAAKRFFDGFWHPRGRDLALLRAAMTRGKVCSLVVKACFVSIGLTCFGAILAGLERPVFNPGMSSNVRSFWPDLKPKRARLGFPLAQHGPDLIRTSYPPERTQAWNE